MIFRLWTVRGKRVSEGRRKNWNAFLHGVLNTGKKQSSQTWEGNDRENKTITEMSADVLLRTALNLWIILKKFCHHKNIQSSNSWIWGIFLVILYFLKIIPTMSCSFQSTSFVLYRFIQIYFIYVDAIVNGIFLISLSDYSLQVDRNTIDFCVLIL